MQISTLKQDVDFLCGSTSATYSDVNKIRNINIAYGDVARVIWESDSIHFDDSNNTDSLVSYRSMANASASYTMPTTALRLNGVELLRANGDWDKLRYINADDMTISREEYLTGVGAPLFYSVEGTQVRLYPPPSSTDVTLSSGLAFRLNRNVTDFPVSATTSEPGFAPNFHRVLSYAAALDFTQDEQQRRFLATQKERLEQGMRKFYSRRIQEAKPKIRPAGKSRWRNYL